MQVRLLQWIGGIVFYMGGNQRGGKRGELKGLTQYGGMTQNMFSVQHQHLLQLPNSADKEKGYLQEKHRN